MNPSDQTPSANSSTTHADSDAQFSRRNFLRHAGLGGTVSAAALAAGGILGTAPTAEAARNGNRDIAILNFALNLEYLEAEYYLYAVDGTGLEAHGVDVTGSGGAPGAVTVKANPQVPFMNSAYMKYAQEIAMDEMNHVVALRATIRGLGGVPASRPPINLLDSFNTAAQAAGIGPSFDPFANDITFLLGAFVFEDVGVTAYKGASPLVANKNILEAAAGILAAEAGHASVVRTSLFAATPNAMIDIPDVVLKISNLRDMLDGADDLDQPLLDTNGNPNLVPLDANGIAFSRSTRQVLNIVYGAVGATQGLFFPNGMRGQITA